MDIGRQKRVVIVELEELSSTDSVDDRDVDGESAAPETSNDRQPALRLDLPEATESARR